MDPTPSQTIGPFFHLCLCDAGAAGLVTAGAEGERITLVCRVLDGDGVPVDDALIELWQAHPRSFSRRATNHDGACMFETVKPGSAAGWDRNLQAPHISVSVFARGLLKRAATRIYFAGEPANAEDPVLALVPEDRRDTLMARCDPASAKRWNFEIHLCGEQETVFLEI